MQYRSATGTGAFSGVIPLGDHHLEPGGTPARQRQQQRGQRRGAADARRRRRPSLLRQHRPARSRWSKSTTRADRRQPSAVLARRQRSSTSRLRHLQHVRDGGSEGSGYSRHGSLNRAAGGRHRQQRADFTAAAPTPVACGDAVRRRRRPVDAPTDATIAEIQGAGDRQPAGGRRRSSRPGSSRRPTRPAASTASTSRPTGTGGDVDLGTHTCLGRDLRVLGRHSRGRSTIGDLVEVTGKVSEFNGLTEITPRPVVWQVLDEPGRGGQARRRRLPAERDAARSRSRACCCSLAGDYTITNNFTTNQFAEIGLAAGDDRCRSRPNVVRPGTRRVRRRRQPTTPRRLVTLDDGASTQLQLHAANKGTPLPWLTTGQRGAGRCTDVTFTDPVVLDYRNNAWKLQPTDQLAGGRHRSRSTFGDTREAAPERRRRRRQDRHVQRAQLLHRRPGRLRRRREGTCTYFNDRDGATRSPSTPARDNGPRGRPTPRTSRASRPRSWRRSTRSTPTSCRWRRSRTPRTSASDRDAALRTWSTR